MWWYWARVVAAGTLAAAPGPRGGDAALAPSRAGHAVPADLSTAARGEHTPSHTSADPPPPPPGPSIVLADDDVVRALEERQPAFLHCFRNAQRDDLMLATARIALRVHVGTTGAVDTAAADGGPAKLDACIEGVARRLAFGPPEQPVDASLTLFFE